MSAHLRHLLFLSLAVGAIPSSADAHVLDEYLQSTLVVIGPQAIRLQMNLTPGVEVAEKVLTEIDRDGDSTVSTAETDEYVARVMLDLTARLDGRIVDLQPTESRFPELGELRTGHGMIQIEFLLVASRLAAGAHGVVLENRHFSNIGSYLFNAALPQSALIQIVRQIRNQNQSMGEIEFAYRPAAAQDESNAGTVVIVGALLFVIVIGLVAGQGNEAE